MIISLHLGLVVDSGALVKEWMARRTQRSDEARPGQIRAVG